MRWINGETFKHKKDRLSEWHIWFAWYPVTVGFTDNGHWIKIWRENILRKGSYLDCELGGWWTWEYKEIEKCQQEK